MKKDISKCIYLKKETLLKRGCFLMIASLICILGGGCGKGNISIYESSTTLPESSITSTENTESTEEKPAAQTDITEGVDNKIVVYVCGAVEDPGVYELTMPSRVNDALEAAGGFSEKADRNEINLADNITDGQKIYFPEEGEEVQQEVGDRNVGDQEDHDGSDRLININKAGVDELTELPGIGATRAGQIVDYRQTYGGFSSKEDLKNVSGIGDSIYKKLETYITVD